MISPGIFFIFFFFFSFLFFRLLGRWKGKTWPKMTKKFCLVRFISQELYIIWLSFMVHLCKMMISPGVFFSFFQNFWFYGLLQGEGRGVQRGKKLSKMRKNSVYPASYHRNHTSYDFHLWYSKWDCFGHWKEKALYRSSHQKVFFKSVWQLLLKSFKNVCEGVKFLKKLKWTPF